MDQLAAEFHPFSTHRWERHSVERDGPVVEQLFGVGATDALKDHVELDRKADYFKIKEGQKQTSVLRDEAISALQEIKKLIATLEGKLEQITPIESFDDIEQLRSLAIRIQATAVYTRMIRENLAYLREQTE
jgi:RPA family protein